MKTSLSTLALAAAALAFVACEFGDAGPPNPAPVSEGGVTSSSGGAAGGPPTTPPKRTVEVRNPLGDSLGNLLIDGDFEYSASIEGSQSQAGWLAFSNLGRRYIRNETGGLCRSGVRCGVLDANVVWLGRGASAIGTGMVASVWAKPPTGSSCAVMEFTIANCNFGGFGSLLEADAEEPDAEGWCHYQGTVNEQRRAVCMYVESTLRGMQRAVVDNAILLPDNGAQPQRVMEPLSAAKQKRFYDVARRVRDMTPIGAPQPVSPIRGAR